MEIRKELCLKIRNDLMGEIFGKTGLYKLEDVEVWFITASLYMYVMETVKQDPDFLIDNARKIFEEIVRIQEKRKE